MENTSNEPQLDPAYAARLEAEITSREEAHATPLPGPLLDAFEPPTVKALGLRLREPVASDWAILQRIGSPLQAEIAELGKPVEDRKPIEYSDEQLWELVFLWTRPVREARNALAEGAQGFRKAALETTADQLPLSAVMDRDGLMKAISGLVLRSFSTRVAHRAAPVPGQEVFQKPPSCPTTA